MIGPLDFSTNHECGLLVEGHELRPQILENWHHPYYAELLEGCGLTKAMDLYKWSLHVSGRDEVMPIIFELADKLEPEHGITIRGMRKRDLSGEIGRFMEIYNAAWERNWGFVPLTDAEIEHYASELKPILDENWAMVAETKERRDGRRRAHPSRLQPGAEEAERAAAARSAGSRRCAKRRRSTRSASSRSASSPSTSTPASPPALYERHFDMAAATPQNGGETGWILETNKPMNKAMEAMGGEIVKRYRIYGEDL